MAYTGITATEAQIDQKTGADVDTNYTDDMKTQMLLQAESTLNVLTKFNWSDWYATSPNVDLKHIVTETTASMVAIEAIKYNMASYPSRGMAEDMVIILRDVINRNVQILKNIDNKNWIEKND